MWIKPLIVVLLILLLISLGSGFVFLAKDGSHGRRLLHSLGVRVALAVLLVALVTYGVLSGKLRSRAPWDDALQQKRASQQQPAPVR